MGNRGTWALKALFMGKRIASLCVTYSQKMRLPPLKRQLRRQSVTSHRRQPLLHRVQHTPDLLHYEHQRVDKPSIPDSCSLAITESGHKTGKQLLCSL